MQPDLSHWSLGGAGGTDQAMMDCTPWAFGSVTPSLREPWVQLSQSPAIKTALENRAFIRKNPLDCSFKLAMTDMALEEPL